jgi:hypothetical protein
MPKYSPEVELLLKATLTRRQIRQLKSPGFIIEDDFDSVFAPEQRKLLESEGFKFSPVIGLHCEWDEYLKAPGN